MRLRWGCLSALLGLMCSPAHALAEDPCQALKLPASWDVRSYVYADVTGDRQPECVLSVWRPWQDWPIARWTAHATPVQANQDRTGQSSHVAVLRPLADGGYRNIWVGSALYQPVTDLAVLPGGLLVTLETTYPRGRQASSVALSRWRWTGFGFGLVDRVPLEASHLTVTESGELRTW